MSIEQLRARTTDWLAPISPEAPAGTDGKYDATHEALRTEIAKLDSPQGGAIDWKRVLSSGGAFLQTKSKDLLVTSYVAYGLFQEHGYAGLATGLGFLADTLEKYWDGLFPPLDRLRARTNALTWLFERIALKLADSPVAASDREAIEALAAVGARIAHIVTERFADEAPAVRPFLDAIERLRMTLPPEAEASNGSNGAAQTSPATTDAGSETAEPSNGAAASTEPASAAPAAPEGVSIDQVLARVEKYIAPIPGAEPAGKDSRNDPDHERMRAEVAKLHAPGAGPVQWNEVLERGEKLLATKTKDLLIASYVACSLYETGGLDGLANGVVMLAECIDRYWSAMYPPQSRMRARVSALSVLLDYVEPRIQGFVPTVNDAERVELVGLALKRLNEVVRDKFGADAPAMRPLIDAAERVRLAVPAPTPVATSTTTTSTSGTGASSLAMPTAVTLGSTDREEVLSFLRRTGSTLTEASIALRRADATDPLSYRLVRTGLYLHLIAPPPAEQGSRTMVPAPADTLLPQLQALLSNGQWAALLDESESSLGANRMLLDLHRFTAVALAGLGEGHKAARQAVLTETGSLLRRLPELVGLEFDDGKPFASDATRAWIREEVLVGGGGSREGDDSSAEAGEQSAREARKLASEGHGTEAIELLQKAVRTAPSGRSRFRARSAMAQICRGLGKITVAEGIYSGLVEEIEKKELTEWDPGIVAETLIEYELCLRDLAQNGRDVTDKVTAVARLLCRVDALAALKTVT